jgi:hypothetical protein
VLLTKRSGKAQEDKIACGIGLASDNVKIVVHDIARLCHRVHIHAFITRVLMGHAKILLARWFMKASLRVEAGSVLPASVLRDMSRP